MYACLGKTYRLYKFHKFVITDENVFRVVELAVRFELKVERFPFLNIILKTASKKGCKKRDNLFSKKHIVISYLPCTLRPILSRFVLIIFLHVIDRGGPSGVPAALAGVSSTCHARPEASRRRPPQYRLHESDFLFLF